jgi:hypothetical protein
MMHGGLGVSRKQDTDSACSDLMCPACGRFSVFPGSAHQQDFSHAGFQFDEVLFVLNGEAFHPPADISSLSGNDILNRGVERRMVQKSAVQQRMQGPVLWIRGQPGMQDE